MVSLDSLSMYDYANRSLWHDSGHICLQNRENGWVIFAEPVLVCHLHLDTSYMLVTNTTGLRPLTCQTVRYPLINSPRKRLILSSHLLQASKLWFDCCVLNCTVPACIIGFTDWVALLDWIDQRKIIYWKVRNGQPNTLRVIFAMTFLLKRSVCFYKCTTIRGLRHCALRMTLDLGITCVTEIYNSGLLCVFYAILKTPARSLCGNRCLQCSAGRRSNLVPRHQDDFRWGSTHINTN